MFQAVAHCPLGLEPVSADEIRSLGLEVGEVLQDEGIVGFDASLEELFKANLRLRSVERVSISFADFEVRRFDQLEEITADLPWDRWLDDRRRLLLRVTSRGSKLYHERAIAERMHKSIGKRIGREIEIAGGAELDDAGRDVQLVIVRLEKNHCTVRIDSSGARLHRRGYRLETARAPLRETLAAGILRACGWEPGLALVDPFCGSGTFLIEAAEQSLGLAAGRRRPFAMERWPFVDAAQLAGLRETRAQAPAAEPAPIIGSDHAEGALRASRGNAERAGVLQAIQLHCRDAADARPASGAAGWVITNPPYGSRIGVRNLRRLYKSYCRTLLEHFPGWDVGLLCPDPGLLERTGLDFEPGPWLNNGGQHVQLVYATVPVRET